MPDENKAERVKSETLDKHLAHIRGLIENEALSSGQSENTAPGTPVPREQDIWKAALKFAPGIPFPDEGGQRRRWITFGNWSNTAVLAMLTFVFGLLGLVGVGLIGTTPANSELAKSLGPFLDIAKIFAGAIVGAAGATAAVSRR